MPADREYPDLVGSPGGAHSIQQWFNPAAYAAPAPLTFGKNKRDSLYEPGVNDVDLSLAKSWALPRWESGKFQLRMDATDLFNHPGFQDPNATIGNSGIGQITGTTIKGANHSARGQIFFLNRNLTDKRTKKRTAGISGPYSLFRNPSWLVACG